MATFKIPRIALRATNRDFPRLIQLGNNLIGGLSGNSNFIDPEPSIISIQAGLDDLTEAYEERGTAENHGTTEAYIDLCQKGSTFLRTLRSSRDYVSLTARTAAGADNELMAEIMVSSGLELAKPNIPVGVLSEPQNFRRMMAINLLTTQAKLKWKHSLNANYPSDVKNYLIMRNTTSDFNTAVQIATVTKSSFIDTNTSGETVKYWYWVIPCNAYGQGVPSQAVMAELTA